MREVTVIGLGEMGSALAAALVRTKASVTVWNRSAAKASRLVADGATLAPSVLTAVRASPIIVVCVSSYAASREILETAAVAAALAGRVVIQLSTGTPKEARDTDAWVRAQGAEYLDGAILAWPSQIGGAHTAILASGAAATFAQAEEVLTVLAGGLRYLGEDVATSSVLFAAVLAHLAGRWIGTCHGALICEAEGFDVAAFGAVLAGLAPILGADDHHMGDVIHRGAFANPESTLQTTAGDIGRLVQHAAEAGINAEVPRFAAALFRRAVDAGHGAEEHAALIKVLRPAA